MVTLREAAQQYLRRGWSVIPAQPSGKKPLIEWAPYSDRLPTPDEVDAWWQKWPNANIAVVTGRVSGLVAVDVDTDRGGNPEPIRQAHPTDLVSRTGSGGFHLFYRYPSGVERVANRVGKQGVDIRGDGGYVIVPPSRHVSGRDYTFVFFGEPGEAPPWVHQHEEPQERETDGHWISDLLRGCGSGGRNDACARLAGYFAAKGVARDVAVAVLQDWNRRNSPPLPVDEVATAVLSVYKGAQRRQPQGQQAARSSAITVVPFDQYMSTYGSYQQRWLVDDWLPTSTIAFCVSPPGTFKTWTIIDLVVSIATGTPFLGKFAVNDQGPALVIQQEDFHGQMVERVATIVSQRFGIRYDVDRESEVFKAEFAPSIPVFFHPDRALRFDNEASMASLEQRIQELRPKVVVIDPLYAAGKVDDYMAKTAEQMLPLKLMRDRYGCSFVIVHHTKKTLDNTFDRQGAWGSQFLNAFLETGWQLRPGDEQTEVVVKRHFKAAGAVPQLQLGFAIKTATPPSYAVDVGEVDVEDKTDLLSLLSSGPLSMLDLASKSGVHKSTISRRLKKLVESGAVLKLKDGRYSVPDLPEF